MDKLFDLVQLVNLAPFLGQRELFDQLCSVFKTSFKLSDDLKLLFIWIRIIQVKVFAFVFLLSFDFVKDAKLVKNGQKRSVSTGHL